MKIVNADILKAKGYDAICVTTNGIVKKDGSLVMGAGIALQFKNKYPDLPFILGRKVATYGNQPFYVRTNTGQSIVSFPTKENYKDKSSLDLIISSAQRIKNLANKFYWTKVAIPAPGVGLGGLSWSQDVEPALSKILDDRFVIHFYSPAK